MNEMKLLELSPEINDALNYNSLVVIDVTSKDDRIVLPEGLKSENSMFFERILFVFHGHFPLSIIQDLLNHNNDNQNILPSNICYLENDIHKITFMIGAFLMRDQTKVLLFGQQKMLDLFRNLTPLQKEEQRKRFVYYKTEQFMLLDKEQEFLMNLDQILLPSKDEENIMRAVLKKQLTKITQNPEQIPKECAKFAHQTFNLVKGQIDSSKVEGLDPERITMMNIYEFFACGVINNNYIGSEFLLGRVKEIKHIEALQQITIDETLVDFAGEKRSNTREEKLKSNSSSFIYKDQSQLEYTQSTGISMSYQQQQQPITLQKQESSLSQSSASQLPPLDQSDLVAADLRPLIQQQIRDVIKVFLGSFIKANTQNTKKPIKLIQIIVNYSKNELIRKQKPKNILDKERKFYQEMTINSNYHMVVTFNVFQCLHDLKCLKFDSDQNISYNMEIIQQYTLKQPESFLNENQINYSFKTASEFEKQPRKVILQNSQMYSSQSEIVQPQYQQQQLQSPLLTNNQPQTQPFNKSPQPSPQQFQQQINPQLQISPQASFDPTYNPMMPPQQPYYQQQYMGYPPQSYYQQSPPQGYYPQQYAPSPGQMMPPLTYAVPPGFNNQPLQQQQQIYPQMQQQLQGNPQYQFQQQQQEMQKIGSQSMPSFQAKDNNQPGSGSIPLNKYGDI